MGCGTYLLLLPLLWLVACGGPKLQPESPIDIEFGRIEEGARGAFARRDLKYASWSFERLLAQARLTDDPGKIADAAYNLAAVRYSLGEGSSVRPLLDEARFELERSGQPTDEVEVLLARIELEAGDAEATLAALSDLPSDLGAARIVREEARVLAGLAELRLGRTDSAAGRLAALESEAAEEGTSATPAVERLRARLHVARGEQRQAAEAFDREAELRQGRSQYALMADALDLSGQAWLRLGKTTTCAERWYRAARSRQGAGNDVAALSLCLLALEALDSTEEELSGRGQMLLTRLRDLVHEIEASQRGYEPPADQLGGE